MKRRSARDRRAAELLAAHAAGGLSPAETAKVEAYLAAHPEARTELDAIGRLLDDVRAAEPRARDAEPDWDAMAREIRAACDDAPTVPRWWWRRLRGRPVALAATGALAVTVAIVVLSRGDEATRPAAETATAPGRESSRSEKAAGEAAEGALEDPAGNRLAATPGGPAGRGLALPLGGTGGEAGEGDALAELRDPVLGDLSGHELEQLERDLDREAAPDDAFVGELLAAGRAEPDAPDSNDGAAEWTRAESDLAFDDDAPAIDPFQAPDYLPIDELTDELTDEAIDAIDRFLAEAHAG